MGYRRLCCCGYSDNSYRAEYGAIGGYLWLLSVPLAFLICAFHIGPRAANPFFIGSAVALPLMVGGGAYLGHKKDTKVL